MRHMFARRIHSRKDSLEQICKNPLWLDYCRKPLTFTPIPSRKAVKNLLLHLIKKYSKFAAHTTFTSSLAHKVIQINSPVLVTPSSLQNLALHEDHYVMRSSKISLNSKKIKTLFFFLMYASISEFYQAENPIKIEHVRFQR